MEKRLDYLDAVKGIGIILVVIGHSTYARDGILTWLTSFHMPLFFIVSGILFAHRKAYRTDWKEFIGKRTKAMLVPYAFFSVIYFCVNLYYYFVHPELMSLKALRNDILFTFSFYGISVLWFLPVLLFGEILLYFLIKKAFPKWTYWLLAIGSGILASFGMNIVSALIHMEKHLALAYIGSIMIVFFRVLAALAFLMTGYALNYLLEKFTLKKELSILAGIGFMLLNAACAFANGRVDLHFLVFNNICYFYLGAVSAALGLILIFRELKVPKLLSYLGTNSLIIMLTHLDCQVMSNAIHFADAMKRHFGLSGIMFYIDLYLALFIAELVLIYVINSFLPFIIGKKYTDRAKLLSMKKKN